MKAPLWLRLPYAATVWATSRRGTPENADVQLTSWSDDSKAALPHYAAAYLFMEYFAQHYGGYENFKTLISLPVRGQDSINTYLARARIRGEF